MQRVLLAIYSFFVVVFLSSCDYYEHRQKMMLFNQIKQTNDSLDIMTKGWHDLLNNAVKTKNFSALNSYRIGLGQFISRKRTLIADMEISPDAEPLRGSENMYLSSQASVVTDVYPKFELYNELTPDSTITNQLRAVANDLHTEISWNLTIKKALDAFAQKNKLKSKR